MTWRECGAGVMVVAVIGALLIGAGRLAVWVATPLPRQPEVVAPLAGCGQADLREHLRPRGMETHHAWASRVAEAVASCAGRP